MLFIQACRIEFKHVYLKFNIILSIIQTRGYNLVFMNSRRDFRDFTVFWLSGFLDNFVEILIIARLALK